METVGAEEIRRVRERYGIKTGRLDPFLAPASTTASSAAAASSPTNGASSPARLPGTGYNYDAAWGGLLDDARLPPCDDAGRT